MKLMYNTIVKCVVAYSCEILLLKQKTENILLATEMDFWRKAVRQSKLERIRNETIKEMIEMKNTLVDDIRTRRLIWYGHVQRMSKELPRKKVIEWFLNGRRRGGRPKKS